MVEIRQDMHVRTRNPCDGVNPRRNFACNFRLAQLRLRATLLCLRSRMICDAPRYVIDSHQQDDEKRAPAHRCGVYVYVAEVVRIRERCGLVGAKKPG